MAKRNSPAPAPAPAPAAVVVATTASTPARRGESTIAQPVAVVWVTCHNMCVAARTAGKPVPSRKALHEACFAAGVTYYTTRTQVQAYLKASNMGTTTPSKLPRGVQIEG